jgi:hypothetical protein
VTRSKLTDGTLRVSKQEGSNVRRLSSVKTPAQRKADQRRREAALAKAHMLRLPRIAVPEAISDYLRATGFMSPAAEDDSATVGRGVAALLTWLIEHAGDEPPMSR